MTKTTQPFDIFGTIDRELDGLLSRFAERCQPEAPQKWSPDMDVFESSEAYEVMLDAPGMTTDDLEVEFHDGELRISGTRTLERSTDAERHCSERPGGSFARTARFSEEIDVDGIEADYTDGVLRVRVPKQASAQATRIPIR